MREDYDFDLFVIGGGSGGVRAARLAGGLGKRVGLAEDKRLGGTCVNVGCIPKKLLVYASSFSGEFEDAAGFGWDVAPPTFDWPTLIANKDREIARLNGIYRRLLTDAKVEIFDVRARIVDPHTVEVGGAQKTARWILVATGGQPEETRIPGCELCGYSDEVFALERLPKRILIAGGGYIGVEFAGVFRGLGSEVTLVHRGAVFLRGFDDEIRTELASEMRKRGIDLVFGATVDRLARQGEGLRAELSTGAKIDADFMLVATGRRPNTRGLGLEEAGVKLDLLGAVSVDATSRSSVESIYAIGDCTNRMNLTPVALAEAKAFIATVFAGKPTTVDYENIPTAVFSQPNHARVGLTELEARLRLKAVHVYKTGFRALKHTLSGRDERTFMKLVVDRDTDRVVGAHMLGPDAGEIIQGIAIAVRCGATKAQFDATIGIHPTAAEELVTMRERVPDPS